MIHTRLLTYFVAIVKEQSFTKAAEKMGLSQPTFSKQMTDLEKLIGKKLLVRDKKAVTLTVDGELFYAKAKEILNLLETLESSVKNREADLTGEVNLGCIDGTSVTYILDVFKAFKDNNPNVSINLVKDEADTLVSMVEKGLLDAAVVTSTMELNSLNYFKLNKQQCYGLLVNKATFKDTMVSIADLETFPMLVTKGMMFEKTILDAHGIDTGVVKIVGTYNALSVAASMVGYGLGCAIVPIDFAGYDKEKVCLVPFKEEVTENICLVTKKYQSYTPTARALISKLMEGVAEE